MKYTWPLLPKPYVDKIIFLSLVKFYSIFQVNIRVSLCLKTNIIKLISQVVL